MSPSPSLRLRQPAPPAASLDGAERASSFVKPRQVLSSFVKRRQARRLTPLEILLRRQRLARRQGQAADGGGWGREGDRRHAAFAAEDQEQTNKHSTNSVYPEEFVAAMARPRDSSRRRPLDRALVKAARAEKTPLIGEDAG